MKRYILSLDEGTTSARAIILDTKTNNIIAIGQFPFKQIYEEAGYVEHNPEDILRAQMKAIDEALKMSGIKIEDISAIGITNQRETVIAWDKVTGKPLYNAIVWQCRRTGKMCEDYIAQGLTEKIRDKTGLIIDAYFSATKIKWLLENVKAVAEARKDNRLLVGTVDTYLVWNLTKGKAFVTDYTNASRTMLFNIHTNEWDEELLELFNIPREILPTVVPSSGEIELVNLYGQNVPISGIAGDQQSALFGHMCFHEGEAKVTYGTGSFILLNTGENPIKSKNKLLTTIAWNIGGKNTYALEGSVFNAGSTITWMKEELQLINSAKETEFMCYSVQDTNGVFLVPAFTGLGAPYWDMEARGIICGLTRGVKKQHIVRAAVEAMAFSVTDILKVMEKDSEVKIKEIRVDGGASKNDFLMRFQSDMLSVKILRPKSVETTAVGVAYLAGLAAGNYDGLKDIQKKYEEDAIFKPSMKQAIREEKYNGWKKAVERSLKWLENS